MTGAYIGSSSTVGALYEYTCCEESLPGNVVGEYCGDAGCRTDACTGFVLQYLYSKSNCWGGTSTQGCSCNFGLQAKLTGLNQTSPQQGQQQQGGAQQIYYEYVCCPMDDPGIVGINCGEFNYLRWLAAIIVVISVPILLVFSIICCILMCAWKRTSCFKDNSCAGRNGCCYSKCCDPPLCCICCDAQNHARIHHDYEHNVQAQQPGQAQEAYVRQMFQGGDAAYLQPQLLPLPEKQYLGLQQMIPVVGVVGGGGYGYVPQPAPCVYINDQDVSVSYPVMYATAVATIDSEVFGHASKTEHSNMLS